MVAANKQTSKLRTRREVEAEYASLRAKILKIGGAKAKRVTCPELYNRSTGAFAVTGLSLTYFAANLRRIVDKKELITFLRSHGCSDMQVPHPRHFGMQNGLFFLIKDSYHPLRKRVLKAGEYCLYSLSKPHPARPAVSHRSVQLCDRAFAALKQEFQCRCAVCGSPEAQANFKNPTVRTRLEKGHMDPTRPLHLDNCIPMCTVCNQVYMNRFVFNNRGMVVRATAVAPSANKDEEEVQQAAEQQQVHEEVVKEATWRHMNAASPKTKQKAAAAAAVRMKKKHKFVDFEGDHTCRGCGLVLQAGSVFVLGYDDRSGFTVDGLSAPRGVVGRGILSASAACNRQPPAVVGPSAAEGAAVTSNDPGAPHAAHKRLEVEDAFFKEIQQEMNVSSSIVEAARHMLGNAKAKQVNFAGEINWRAMAAACLYHAAKDVPGGGRTIDEICTRMAVLKTAFTKASKALCLALGNTNVVSQQALSRGVRTSELLNRTLGQLKLPAEQARLVRSTANRLLDKSSELESRSATNPKTLIATALYMACTREKIKGITMATIVMICGANSSSVVRTERQILEHLRAARTAAAAQATAV